MAGKLRRDSREKNSLTCDHETRNRRGSLEGREVVSDGSEESDKLREREAGTEKKEGGEKTRVSSRRRLSHVLPRFPEQLTLNVTT